MVNLRDLTLSSSIQAFQNVPGNDLNLSPDVEMVVGLRVL